MQATEDLLGTFGARMRSERTRLGYTQQQLADAIASTGVPGGTRQSVRKYEQDERHPDAPFMAELARMGFDVLFLLGSPNNFDERRAADRPIATARFDTMHLGEPAPVQYLPESALLPVTGAMAARPLVLSLPLGGRGGPDTEVDYHVIPRHIRPAAAGRVTPGEWADSDAPAQDQDVLDRVGEMAFTGGWIRQHLVDSKGPLTSVRVKGDSMASTLLDGDTIVIDQGVTHVEVDGIYVLDVYGRRLVKRVQMLYDGALVLISDNAAYERQTIPRDAARDVHVVGRMVWPRAR